MLDRIEMAYRLGDLRSGYKLRGTQLSLMKLSKEIEKKTKVKITHTTLQQYEDPDNSSWMNVNNLAALAEFYNVSVDYLLCLSDSKSRKNYNISKRVGLSDKSIETLENWKEIVNTKDHNGFNVELIEHIKPGEINDLIEYQDFKKLIYGIRAIKEINNIIDPNDSNIKNPYFGNNKTNHLINELGLDLTNQFITDRLLDIVREFLKSYCKTNNPEENTRSATQADIDDFFNQRR